MSPIGNTCVPEGIGGGCVTFQPSGPGRRSSLRSTLASTLPDPRQRHDPPPQHPLEIARCRGPPPAGGSRTGPAHAAPPAPRGSPTRPARNPRGSPGPWWPASPPGTPSRRSRAPRGRPRPAGPPSTPASSSRRTRRQAAGWLRPKRRPDARRASRVAIRRPAPAGWPGRVSSRSITAAAPPRP